MLHGVQVLAAGLQAALRGSSSFEVGAGDSTSLRLARPLLLQLAGESACYVMFLRQFTDMISAACPLWSLSQQHAVPDAVDTEV